ncbi:MAG: acetyl-CoA decarbonylase/synthase complex subunit gamma [Candidatus Omnitrophota bacterium]
MALSGLDIYKHLPKTNCRQCGFPTCLAFAMGLAKRQTTLDKCPYITDEARGILDSASQPPIRLVSIGSGENKLEIGNETVLFRHEEKFFHPCGIGFLIEDNEPASAIEEKLETINRLQFERVGQPLKVDLIAIRQTGSVEKFVGLVEKVSAASQLGLVLMSDDSVGLRAAAQQISSRRPLLYCVTKDNLSQVAAVAKEFSLPVVTSATSIEEVSQLAAQLNNLGVGEQILEIKSNSNSLVADLWNQTQIRRLALKNNQRSLGFPTLTLAADHDEYQEINRAAIAVSKYAGVVILKSIESWKILALLTLRQNIYTDPQKPLQVEPKIYPVGNADEKSPVLVTTNFSLTFYTVLSEVEASKVPSHLVSVDTEGMSVLTAWAAEKFTAESIANSLNKLGVKEKVNHNQLVIPGYVAVLSGELEDKSGCRVLVGPKEAAGIPSFLKSL